MDCENNSNVDSDHSLTWEDFFGSSTDLTPTLIGIYDSLLELEPADTTSTAAKENGPFSFKRDETKRKMAQPISNSPSKDPRLIAGSVKLPGFSKDESPAKEQVNNNSQTQPLQTVNRVETPPSKMSYVSRLKSFTLRKNNNEVIEIKSENIPNVNSEQQRLSDGVVVEDNSASNNNNKFKSDSGRGNVISKINSEVIAKVESNRKHWADRSGISSNSFDNLSPNVKRMLNSAGADNSSPKSSIIQPKKQPGLATVGRSSYRSKHSNIPLMGATSKITQTGVDIISTADIYDTPSDLSSSLTKINVRSNQPTNTLSSFVSPTKSSLMNRVANEWSSNTNVSSFSTEKIPRTTVSSDVEDVRGSIYDVPVSSPVIYDVPVSKPVQIESMEISSVEGEVPVEHRSEYNLIHKQESMDVDIGDYVFIESPEKIKSLSETKKNIDNGISPSKPTALNIALAIRNIADMKEDSREDKSTSKEEDKFNKSKCPPNVSMLYSSGSGSTGNLKMSSQPEHENRLASQTIIGQVTRPLSMSSIASSSSTSSSGAQNKGGINSAYLASIESLDDHSDIDNGVKFAKNSRMSKVAEAHKSRDTNDGASSDPQGASCVTVARAPTPPRPRYCDPSLTQLQRVCTEIVDTECVYVEDLRQVVEGYLYPWRDGGTFSPEDLDHLFSNIEEIYHFNNTFLEHLNQCDLQAIPIARCFAVHSGGFKIYSRYCTGYPATMAALASVAREPAAAQGLRARQAELGHPLPLGSYLLKPVQRILKYHLLLQNLVKYCTCHETEFALHKMTGIAQHINEMKKKHEHTVRVQEIQSLLYGWNGQDLTTYGELCAEGTFRVFGAKAMRHAFLFDKMLLLTKSKEYGILAYKFHILCNNLMLVESIQGQPLSFHVIPFDNPRMQVTLQARNVQHKREWTLLLKRVILENYNAVIPSHARQLVMQLGQNRTDDDMLAEKSSALMSHSSMRKQLSAPEYLEKRKYERERRKSFETSLKHRIKRSTLRKGQNIDGISENDGTDKDGSIRNDSAFDEYVCDCQNSCSNMECSNFDLCKECQEHFVCSECRNKNDKLHSSTFNLEKCSHCEEFQSQSSINTDISEHKCCDRSIHYIDDQSSRENVNVDGHERVSYPNNHYSENLKAKSGCICGKSIMTGSDLTKQQLEVADVGDDRSKGREIIQIKKTCLKCQKIRENITVEDNLNYSSDVVNHKCEHDVDKNKRNFKDDSQTHLTIPKVTGSLRRKSEPGMSNINFDPKDWKTSVENEKKDCAKSQENLTYEKKLEGPCSECRRNVLNCSNCGKIINLKHSCLHKSTERKCRSLDREANPIPKDKDPKHHAFEVKMYNSKTVPKKISKIKKNRAKTLRHLAVDSTAKFYTDFPTDNVLHISESTDSINTLKSKNDEDAKGKDSDATNTPEDTKRVTDPMEDEELYRNYIQKTDSFKQSELEKDKAIKKLTEKDSDKLHVQTDVCDKKEISGSSSPRKTDSNGEDSDDGHGEKPLEVIISQLLMQNREFQKILKKHQMRNANNRRHQRLLKSNSNPEKMMLQNKENQNKLKPKFGRQTSVVETVIQDINNDLTGGINDQGENKPELREHKSTYDEHIYETLIDAKGKSQDIVNTTTTDDNVPCLSTFAPLRKPPSPKQEIKTHTSLVTEKLTVPVGKQTRISLTESDYVYLCFEGDNNIDAYKVPKIIKKVEEVEDNGEYAVPSPVIQKVKGDEVERRLLRDKVEVESRINHASVECHYDNASEVWKRISNDTVIENPNSKMRRNNDHLNNITIDGFLESENGPKSPNVPEIWVQSQKEHFTTSRDKKSGSLPRSFQVNLNEFDEKVLPPPIKMKMGAYNKVYLSKDGKVLQTDRPFTIASDHSEISYEDIERFIKANGDSGLKFPYESSSNRSSCSFADGDAIEEGMENMTKSTLELEAEIDRCYKNNIAMRREQLGELANVSDSNLLSTQHLMDNSISSSMEVMNDKLPSGNSQEDIVSMHPEHKIYKTTMNVLSIKNVLNRFKLKSKQNQEQLAQQNDKSGITNGERRKNSKGQPRNLMQRFKSIIHDEQIEKSTDLTDSASREDDKSGRKDSTGSMKNSITVTLTQVDETTGKSSDITISKSFCESNEKGVEPLEKVSKSCNNITFPFKSNDNIYSNIQDMSSSLKSTQNSIQDLNKLPIYKQGSRHLGARIAQSDYADPKLLRESNRDLDKVNVFINKNSLRPDSLLSNSSHFTSSSESYAVTQIEANKNTSFLYRDSIVKHETITVNKPNCETNKVESKTIFDEEKESSRKSLHEQQKILLNLKNNSDESYYEKSFDEIEHILDNEIFRDSAIYSDPDDSVSYSPDCTPQKYKIVNECKAKIIPKAENAEKTKVPEDIKHSTPNERTNTSKVEIPVEEKQSNTNEKQPVNKLNRSNSIREKCKEFEATSGNKIETSVDSSLKASTISKMAPPVPVKPSLKLIIPSKATNIPAASASQTLDQTKTETTKPTIKYIPRKDKGLSVSLKITETDVKDGVTVETEQKVSETINSQHEVSAKLNLRSPPVANNPNIFQFPPVTEKIKPGIPRPNFERPTSSNIQMKRLSFERCSLDSSTINRRTKSVAEDVRENSCVKITSEDGVFTKSVQERRKEIEMMTNVNEQKSKLLNRKSLDSSEHSTVTFTRSVSMKLSNSNNNSSNDQLKISKNTISSVSKVPVQKCNIPLPSTSNSVTRNISTISKDSNVKNNNESSSKDGANSMSDVVNANNVASSENLELRNREQSTSENSRGGWVKHVVNRFQ